MLFLNNLKKKRLKFLTLGILVSLLLIISGEWANNLLFLNPSFSLMSVNAQTSIKNQTQQKEDNQNQEQEKQQNNQAENSESADKEGGKLDLFKIIMGAIAGLVLFLYGVTRMAEGMEALAGDRAKKIIKKFTTNRFAGVLTGTLATTILDSSSVTIIIVIAMVSAGLLTFIESLGVVLGSNIGTTIGAQVIAFKINAFAPIAMFAGFLLIFLGKTDRWKNIGLIILGIGLLFFGLDTIEDAMEPFKEYQPFINRMENLGENTLLGALIGALFTILVQSSSATVAIVVTLASQGLVTLPAGIALMLGAEVGTCADTLVSTIGRERPAVRTGVFHLIFNIVTAAVGILFATQLAGLALWVSKMVGAENDVALQIANAQLIINLLGVAIVNTFLPWIARGLEILIPKGKNETEFNSDKA